MAEEIRYIPSPIGFTYDVIYSALANSSGRMQYYKEVLGEARTRIGRNEFISAYNSLYIIAVKPIQVPGPVFQLKFYAIKNRKLNKLPV
ncbi:MAG: hypothetical protein KDC79_05765 [Cyclobacteriaceae bacterium]|nr:hypothetical protein [Cyclobacteriaceae bacterium]